MRTFFIMEVFHRWGRKLATAAVSVAPILPVSADATARKIAHSAGL